MRLPDFICLGAMRCGSTTLWELLRRHPRIFMPEKKEIHFFDNVEGAYDAGLAQYAALFDAAAVDCKCGEITPSYLYLEEVGPRIRQATPDAKLLVILRDPIGRAWSHYWYEVMRGFETLGFEQAIDAEAQRLQSGDLPDRMRYSYIARGKYVEQIRQYERLFGREQLCVILLDDLIGDTRATMGRVFAHLGVQPPSEPTAYALPRSNKMRHPRHRGLHVMSKRIQRWANRDDALPRRVVRRLATLGLNLNQSSVTPRMAASTRQRLQAVYRPYDEQLAQWLGRPLPWLHG